MNDRIDLRKPWPLTVTVLAVSLAFFWFFETLFSSLLWFGVFLLASSAILKVSSFLHEELHYATLVRKGYRAHKVVRHILPNGYTYCDDPIKVSDFREALLAPFWAALALAGVLVMASLVVAPRFEDAPPVAAFWGLCFLSGCSADVYWYAVVRRVPDTYWAVILKEKDVLFSSETAAREFIEVYTGSAPSRR